MTTEALQLGFRLANRSSVGYLVLLRAEARPPTPKGHGAGARPCGVAVCANESSIS